MKKKNVKTQSATEAEKLRAENRKLRAELEKVRGDYETMSMAEHYAQLRNAQYQIDVWDRDNRISQLEEMLAKDWPDRAWLDKRVRELREKNDHKDKVLGHWMTEMDKLRARVIKLEDELKEAKSKRSSKIRAV
jgi:chromosome segregation ATPase